MRLSRTLCRLGPLAAAVLVVGLLPATGAAAAGEVHEEVVALGTSVQGRPLVAVHRWRDGARRPVLVIGSMHGDERAGERVVRRLRTAHLPPRADLWLVRTVNPDGAAAGTRTNARGVDLNRNFPRRWLPAGAGTSKWSGPGPASEPETRAVLRLLRGVEPRTTLVVHQPLFGIDSYRAKSMRLVRDLSAETGLPVRPFDCHGGCHGTLTDWHNTRLDGRAVTVELGRRASDRRVRLVARAALARTGAGTAAPDPEPTDPATPDPEPTDPATPDPVAAADAPGAGPPDAGP